jgi:class 3 adenylate cyclase/predicted ATPase
MTSSIEQWLEELGLSKYSDLLAEHEIGLDILPDLSEADLKDIGIPLGDRKRLLKAAAQVVPPEASSDTGAPPVVAPEAERRQLTVMFCDLAGSTALSERLDPEELRQVLQAYQRTCADVVARYEGHIAKYIGDGLLVYFGYPHAHEDDAARAVHAGLELVTEVARLNDRRSVGPPVDLQVHLGIHTGLVVAGEMGAGETREALAIVGDTPNLAARLEGLAEPGTILISESTLALVEGLFVCDDLGARTLKGFAEPIGVYRVRGETAARSRFEAVSSRGLSPLVGREQEVALLLDRWDQAKGGEGQVTLLSGEAGIGKSRITKVIHEHAEQSGHVRIRYQCSPYHVNSALHPVIDHIERAAGFVRDDPPVAKLDKLEALLRRSTEDLAAAMPLFATLLSIPAGERYPAPDLSPEQLKDRTFAALLDQMDRLAAQTPLLIVFEDVHWIDPTSQELLDRMVERVDSLRVLIVITFRPVYAAPWGGHPHVTALALNRIGRQASQAMVSALTGNKTLPDDVLEQILAKTDGVPLFVEELTKTVLEAGLLEEKAGRYVLSGPLPSLAIPATLHDSLMARLDRLSPIKEIAQTAAVIGREFSHELLAAVCRTGEGELEDALDQLLEAELVFRRGSPPKASYIFKHALVQDAAYESLLKSRRQELHETVARVLEEQFSDIRETQPELLAHHFTEAGLTEKALAYWLEAGRQSVARCAHVEAISHLEKGLALLDALPKDLERTRIEIDYRLALGAPIGASMGIASCEFEENYLSIRDLCDRIGETQQLFPALWNLWMNAMMRGEMRRSCRLADQVLELGERRNDTGHQIEAHHAQWTSHFLIGEPVAALEHCRHSDTLYQADEHHELTYTYGGHDPGVCALNIGSTALWVLGYPDQARDRIRSSVALARKLNHSSTLADALIMAMFIAAFDGDLSNTRAAAAEVREFTGTEKLQDYASLASAAEGWILFEQGETEAGLELVRHSAPILLEQGDPWNPSLMGLCASVLGRDGTGEEGLELLDASLTHFQANQVHWWDAELYRIKGELLLASGNNSVDDAEACLHRALEIARQQQAKSLELRVASSLARLWKKRDKDAEARDLLQPIIQWFPEDLAFADLKKARSLLTGLISV